MRVVSQESATVLLTLTLFSEIAVAQTDTKPSFEPSYIQISPSSNRFQFAF